MGALGVFDPVSPPADAIVEVARLALVIAAGIFVVVVGLLLYAIVRFRLRPGDDGSEPPQVYGSDQIELAWDQVNYPEELEHYTTLRDGTEIFFRPIKPVDEAALSEMLLTLATRTLFDSLYTAFVGMWAFIIVAGTSRRRGQRLGRTSFAS